MKYEPEPNGRSFIDQDTLINKYYSYTVVVNNFKSEPVTVAIVSDEFMKGVIGQLSKDIAGIWRKLLWHHYRAN